jgi:hypothetical protein
VAETRVAVVAEHPTDSGSTVVDMESTVPHVGFYGRPPAHLASTVVTLYELHNGVPVHMPQLLSVVPERGPRA